jgi:hypothetical protein
MVSIFIFFTFQNFGMWQTTTLNRNLVPEIWRGYKQNGFGILGGLPPLKGTFLGRLGLWVHSKHILDMTWHWVIFCTICCFYLHFQLVGVYSHTIASILPQGGLSTTFLHCRASILQGSLLNYFGHWRVTLWVNQKTKLRCSHSLISYPYLIFIDFPS